jgi:hypothetical protein
MAEILPSVGYDPDNPRPVGFVDRVNRDHLRSAGQAISDVAAVAGEGTGGSLVRVCLCSARYIPRLPFELYSFQVQAIGSDGEAVDPMSDDSEARYAIVANHPVEVQREATLLFLYDLVFRQKALRAIRDNANADPGSTDLAVADAVGKARTEFRDRIRGGWHSAALAIAGIARSYGMDLQIRYEVDLFPSWEDVVRRMPLLRRAYNTLDRAREVVDKTVSMIGGQDPRISAPGLPDALIETLQRQLQTIDLRHFMNQTLRDSEVCGNGYLVMPSLQEGLFNLRPDAVQVRGEQDFWVLNDGRWMQLDSPVLHARAVEQFDSPYGFSLLEVVLPELHTRHTFAAAERFARQILQQTDRNSKEGRWAVNTIAMVERVNAEHEQRLARLLRFPREWMSDASEGLYFDGQENM